MSSTHRSRYPVCTTARSDLRTITLTLGLRIRTFVRTIQTGSPLCTLDVISTGSRQNQSRSSAKRLACAISSERNSGAITLHTI